jgi:HlyD family secretion protein
VGVIGAASLVLLGDQQAEVRYETAPARRGDLTVTVIATGELQPVVQVEVGTEISGTIETVGADFNDRVRVGQVLARLDTDQLQARRRQAEAALVLARARVKEGQATVLETRKRQRRVQDLIKGNLSTQEEADTAAAAFARAEAVLAVAEAQVVQAQAQVDADRRMLEKAEIRSPIDGIVLQRQIEPGQTVAASLQTPVLFTLAENLAHMELQVAVDEADVGKVREGQTATFTVDAYPDRHFAASITQVRFAPKTVDGVVTYQTVLSVDNADLSLRPGMTATAEITVDQRKDRLLIPNAALRFTPAQPGQPAKQSGGSLFNKLFPRPVRGPAQSPKGEEAAGKAERRVWVLEEGKPVAVPVKLGATDGRLTEVLEGSIEVGTALVVDRVRERR